MGFCSLPVAALTGRVSSSWYKAAGQLRRDLIYQLVWEQFRVRPVQLEEAGLDSDISSLLFCYHSHIVWTKLERRPVDRLIE